MKLKVLDLNIARSLNEYMKFITETPCLDKLGYSLDNNSSRNIPWAYPCLQGRGPRGRGRVLIEIEKFNWKIQG